MVVEVFGRCLKFVLLCVAGVFLLEDKEIRSSKN